MTWAFGLPVAGGSVRSVGKSPFMSPANDPLATGHRGITPLYWNVWGVIALHHEREASIERERALEAYRQNGDYYLAPEWYASVIAIAASAFAIEAWYGAIKGPLPHPGGAPTASTAGDAKARFPSGPEDKRLARGVRLAL